MKNDFFQTKKLLDLLSDNETRCSIVQLLSDLHDFDLGAFGTMAKFEIDKDLNRVFLVDQNDLKIGVNEEDGALDLYYDLSPRLNGFQRDIVKTIMKDPSFFSTQDYDLIEKYIFPYLELKMYDDKENYVYVHSSIVLQDILQECDEERLLIHGYTNRFLESHLLRSILMGYLGLSKKLPMIEFVWKSSSEDTYNNPAIFKIVR